MAYSYLINDWFIRKIWQSGDFIPALCLSFVSVKTNSVALFIYIEKNMRHIN